MTTACSDRVDVYVTAARMIVDVYVRADEFNLSLLCLTSLQHKGQRSVTLRLTNQCDLKEKTFI